MVEHRDEGVSLSKSLAAARTSPEEELPEWEELTPEILQDECLRGDTMIRWAVVLLALLLGWMRITETSVLVAVRTGEVIASRAGLPPRVDPFSATAAGRPWTNLHWLSDLALAGVHAVGGMPGLTILCAMAAGLSFWALSRINQGADSTWWPSYCYALALIAAVPMFQPGETSWTILGMSLLLWGLHLWTVSPSGRLKWQLPLLFVLWGNLDSRAWLGLVVLVAYAVGTTVSRQPALRKGWKQTFAMTGACLVAGLLVTPWPGGQLWSQAARALLLRESREYGTVSEFFPSLSAPLAIPGQSLPSDVFVFLCWALMAISLFTLILNVVRIEAYWPMMWLAATGFSFLSGELACAGAVVNSVVAAINGQAWYRRTFSQEYSIDSWSVLSGRAGRAVTVLALFFVAWAAVNGTMLGAQRRRIGWGLDPRWSNRIASLKQDVDSRTYGDGVFPMLPVQGDLLIWLGKKPFIDSRLGLYVSGEENLKQLHLDTRASILAPPRAQEDEGINPQAWKETLSRFKINNAQVRLWGEPPGYGSFVRLLIHPDWRLTGLGAAAANFVRVDVPDPELRKYVEQNRADQFIQAAFRPAEPPRVTSLTGTWAYPESTYNEWLIQKLKVSPAAAHLAQHYDQIIRDLGVGLTAEQITAISTLAIRHAREALAVNPNDPLSYRVLAHAQEVLQAMENAATVAGGNPQLPTSWRLAQQRAAAFNAVRGGGNDPQNLLMLTQFLFNQRDIDLGLQALDDYEALAGPMPAQMQAGARMVDVYRARPELEKFVSSLREQLEQTSRAGTGSDPMQLVQRAMANRCPGLALSLMEKDLTLIQTPDAKLIHATLLQTCGRIDEAYEIMGELQRMLESTTLPPEAESFKENCEAVAAEIHLAAGDAAEAIRLWEPPPWKELEQNMLRGVLVQPFAAMMVPEQEDLWAGISARSAYSALAEIPDSWGQAQLRSALAEIQIGQLKEGTDRLRLILKNHPNFQYRGLVTFYLKLLTGEQLPIYGPQPVNPAPDVSLLGVSGPPSPALPQPLEPIQR